MDLESIQKFFDSRPSLSKKPIAKEIGISRQYLIYILNGDRPLTDSVKEKMDPVLFKYGYRETEPEYKRTQKVDFPENLTRQQISKLTGYAESYLQAKLSGAGVEAIGRDISGYNLYDKQEVMDGVGFKSKIPGAIGPERKGIGLRKAHEAIAKLKESPLDDDLLQEGYDTVIRWIGYNR